MTALTAACFGRDLEHEGWPTVSVVIPIRNEAAHLETAVASVLAQEYPRQFDVCLAVAPSHDATLSIAKTIADRDPRVTVVANPRGPTPAGLNAAIAASRGDVVVRVDGHSNLSDGYIKRAVETMVRTGAVNVGGMQVPEPRTPFEEAVASATTSWLGTGGATYRLGGDESPVDTVYLGVFDRSAGEVVGWFDETLIRNQDYELNIRLRKAGGEVRFDPALSVGYRPRSSWPALARQYFEYGYWKAEVLRRHPESLRFRQLVPTLFGPALAVLAMIAYRSRLARTLLSAYAMLAFLTAPGKPAERARIGVATATMHVAWSAGLWRSLVDGRRRE